MRPDESPLPSRYKQRYGVVEDEEDSHYANPFSLETEEMVHYSDSGDVELLDLEKKKSPLSASIKIDMSHLEKIKADDSQIVISHNEAETKLEELMEEELKALEKDIKTKYSEAEKLKLVLAALATKTISSLYAEQILKLFPYFQQQKPSQYFQSKFLFFYNNSSFPGKLYQFF